MQRKKQPCAASRENRPNAGCDNVEISWVKVRPVYTGPVYCVTSNCHNSVNSKDFLFLFSTSYNLAIAEHFHGKISKLNFLALGWFSRGVAQFNWLNFSSLTG